MQSASASDFDHQNQSKMDEALLVRFYVKPFQDQNESRKQGRPVFIDREYVEIRTPGSRDAVARPAQPKDIARFPRHYEAFKNRTSQDIHEGTPLSEWPLIARSLIEELTFFNVKTVEQLIAMPDEKAQQFMGLMGLKQKAKEWLELSKEYASANDLKDELAKRDDEIAELKAAVAALQKPRTTKKKVTKKKVSKKKE